jgi:hypothetical protein
VTETTPSPVNRRGLLRRASTVAAVAGAAGVATTLNAAPAAAAVGDNLQAGFIKDAVAATTGVKTNSSSAVAFSAENPAGAQLRLVPRGDYLSAGAPVGSFNVTTDGNLEFQSSTVNFAADVLTTHNATSTYPVGPVRVLDTRNIEPGDNRTNILNPSCLDAQGRLKAGNTMILDLSKYVFFGWAAIGNLTMQSPEQGGFCTVFPGDLASPPTASSVNFLAGWPVSNGVLVRLGSTDESDDVIKIYSSCNTHILFDLTGLVVASNASILWTPTVSAATLSPSAREAGNAATNRAAQIAAQKFKS